MQNVLAVKEAPMSRDGRAGNFPESQETLRNSNDFSMFQRKSKVPHRRTVWHLKLAQEGRMVETYGLRKVFYSFSLAIRYFNILLTPHSPRNAKTHGFPTFSQRF